MLFPSPRIRRPVGIDLGTTNSVIAMLDDSGSLLLTGTDAPAATGSGRQTFPSVVARDAATGQLLAGPPALTADSATLPLASVKRYMGLDRRFPLGSQMLSPAEVSAAILRGLRPWMAHTLNDPRRLLDQAILTMPAYFNHNQIEATRLAGELAGFEVVELLHEPTAAALYYSWLHQHGDATYLVYDLGGGTFDVSIIRRRLGDYEVLSVSGDPFLGGDDFDRLLAAHLIDSATWRWQDGSPARDVAALLDPTRPDGAVPFARLARLAEGIKADLSGRDRVERYVPRVAATADGRTLSLEATVTRPTFERLIRDRLERTIDRCHEALSRARDQAGVCLTDLDHIILVGGSSRVPLVREVVRAAFANPDLPERVRSCDLLLHEPDLCVAYGAALRAAGHGTRYLLPLTGGELEVHLTSPACTTQTTYLAAGIVRVTASDPEAITEGGSVQIRALASGLVEESFLDTQGGFTQAIELIAESDNRLEWTVCDGAGQPCAGMVTTVRHRAQAQALGQGVLPTQLITKPLAIDVLTRGRQRTRQVIAPIGAALPGTFRCTCRTADQSGRIVVPVCEENRIIKQLVIEGMDPDLPVGSPVEVEMTIDVRHVITVAVRVRAAGGTDHLTTAHIEPPPPPTRPTREAIDQLSSELDRALEGLSGRLRSRFRARAVQLREELLEALSFDDEPRAIQRMAELGDLLRRAEQARLEALDPPWPRFAGLVRQCLDLAGEVARQTGRDNHELLEHVHAQERYAEQAQDEHNQKLYRECWDNLEKYAGYLGQLLRNTLPRQEVRPTLSPEEEARRELARFRDELSRVWKQARGAGRTDLGQRMAEIARLGSTFTQRLAGEPVAVLRDARRLGVEIDKVRRQLEEPVPPASGDGSGLLEGSL